MGMLGRGILLGCDCAEGRSKGRIDERNRQRAILVLVRLEKRTDAAVPSGERDDETRSDDAEVTVGKGTGDDGLRVDTAVGVEVIFVRGGH
ncbi:hypothetical protein J3459_012053 [Metarhizium acridum]|nr:hypothetical protein J3459_012053 [Metarhizium acridum]